MIKSAKTALDIAIKCYFIKVNLAPSWRKKWLETRLKSKEHFSKQKDFSFTD